MYLLVWALFWGIFCAFAARRNFKDPEMHPGWGWLMIFCVGINVLSVGIQLVKLLGG